MAGKLTNEDGNIYVEFDYNNIIIVDPNKKVDSQGNVSERLVDHENLVMYANLDAQVVPRTKLSIGGSPQDSATLVQVANVNFLKGNNGKFLTNQYYDEFTGKDALSGGGYNQSKEEIITKDEQNYYKNTVVNTSNIVDNGLLGITSINITTNSSFIPVVTMTLEDVQGRALFQLGDNSPYAAFFNLPYCIFYLTLKGYYGKAIRYQLNLETFNAKYNSYSGNYTVDLRFKGYKFNILNEISMGHLLATPHMYSKTFNVTRTNIEGRGVVTNNDSDVDLLINSGSGEATNSNEEISYPVVSEKGYQKIVEVYSDYKSKNLIPQDFPELTLAQLMNKLELFEKNILNSYKKVDVEPLTNIRSYKKTLNNYYSKVYGGQISWFNEFIDNRPFITKNGEKLYAFKNIDNQVKETAKTQLKNIISDNNKILSENPTLGKNSPSPIPNPITYDIIEKIVSYENIDWEKTAIQRTGEINPSAEQVEQIKDQFQKIFKITVELDENNQIIPSSVTLNSESVFFVFEGDKSFDTEIRKIEALSNKKLSEYEDLITKNLLDKISDSKTGIGFKPTIRNIVAVIMASAEAFIRLMDDVHTEAWNLKYDNIRKNVFSNISSSAPNSDTFNDIGLGLNANLQDEGLSTAKIPVYPWPQFFVETPEDKKGRFQLKYLADPSVVDLTKGYLYEKWPEVEFVEEYIRGLTQKFNSPQYPSPLSDDLSTPINVINAIEFPNTYLAYINKEEAKFIYEIWERQFITGYYSGYVRLNDKQKDSLFTINSDIESINIIFTLNENAPFLTKKIKELNINASNIENVLKVISNNGISKSYQDYIRGFFNTSYIRNITDNSFSIHELNDLGRIPDSPTDSNILIKIAKSANNEPIIVDTYPFTDPIWVSDNMSYSSISGGNQVYNTNNVLTIYEPINSISNFNDLYNYKVNRPVVSFNYLNPVNPLNSQDSYLNIESSLLFDFYIERSNEYLIPTEGTITFQTPSLNLPLQKTTSILNTPYFINAIIDGNERARNKETNPYVSAAYLFVNSLPLSTLRERYKSVDSLDLDYIASTIKKYGGLHKLPYVWILKIGSIWHRYKVYKETNTDILENVWDNIDYVKNYSPIDNNVNQEYSFEIPSDGGSNELSIKLQEETDSNVNINVGFFPKIINEFNYFYNGYDLYKDYTSAEIQKSVNDGLKLHNFSDSNISAIQNNKSLFLQTWSILLKDGMEESSKGANCLIDDVDNNMSYFIVPSFGSPVNETKLTCLDNSTERNVVVDLTNNSSVYNGSVRGLWASSNYGYFDSDQITKPNPDQYIKKVSSIDQVQSNFDLLNYDDYSTIEEIFSVFDKSTLDIIETEFLNFSRSQTNSLLNNTNSGINKSTYNTNDSLKNFQTIIRNIMNVSPKKSTQTYDEYFSQVIDNQFNTFSTIIKNLMEYDVIIRNGNPSNFKRRIFSSFVSSQDASIITDPITFNAYIPGTLPDGTISLQDSKTTYPDIWTSLELEVGFSTIPELVYSDDGSYITDFFIDNNIEFTKNNVILLSPLIKMYATQKLNNPFITSEEFKDNIISYLNECGEIQSNSINTIMDKVRTNLPVQFEITEKKIKSIVDGEQSKIELYEVFKALNDKWIAGGNYQEKTFFEDILFLDRASRNIGDTILIDIFDLKRTLNKNSLNNAMSVYTFISGLLIQNNFTVMNLPAYINFYNVESVDGVNSAPNIESSLEFADNMWGNFLDVDYRNSSPKMVCYFVGKPSQHLDLPKTNSLFRNDGFELRRLSDNPLIEDIQNKTDWNLSNRCVGFTVDMGIRNQNVFNGFSISQDQGTATSESVNTILNMVNQSTGREVATQNIGLYSLYKQRSYTCNVTCLGNALLQPTMYFNLRHVPMFNGPYMILEVNHNISPGSFETSFKGIRQGIYDLPNIDKFLQSINKNLLTRLEEILRSRKSETQVRDQSSIPDSKKAEKKIERSDNTKAPQGSCIDRDVQFSQFENIDSVQTQITQQELADAIISKTSNTDLQAIIYSLCYLKTFVKPGDKNGKFVSWNNNYVLLTLDNNYGESANFFDTTYSCVNINDKSKPIANFESLDSFLDFMVSRLENNVNRILNIGLNQYYVCNWPVSANNPSEEYFLNNKINFENSLNTMTLSMKSAESVGLTPPSSIKKESTSTFPPTVTPTITMTPSSTQPC